MHKFSLTQHINLCTRWADFIIKRIWGLDYYQRSEEYVEWHCPNNEYITTKDESSIYSLSLSRKGKVLTTIYHSISSSSSSWWKKKKTIRRKRARRRRRISLLRQGVKKKPRISYSTLSTSYNYSRILFCIIFRT